MSEKKHRVKASPYRTIYKIDNKEFQKHVARIATGNFRASHEIALDIVRTCVYAQKGLERKELSVTDAAEFIKKGYK